MRKSTKSIHIPGPRRSEPPRTRIIRQTAAAFVACSVALFASHAAAADANISIEINKLESKQDSCRTYVLVNNTSQTAYSSLTLDLVMFRTDGIMDRRLALKLAPVRKEKRSLKLFDLKGIACDQVGSFLLNDVMECATPDGPVEDCLSKLNVSSRADAKLTK